MTWIVASGECSLLLKDIGIVVRYLEFRLLFKTSCEPVCNETQSLFSRSLLQEVEAVSLYINVHDMHFLVVGGAGHVRVGVGLSPNGLRACLTACSQTPFPASQPPPFLSICHFGFVPVCSRKGSSAYTCKSLSATTT